MSRFSTPTGYARLAPWQARIVLVLLVVMLVVCVAITLSPLASDNFDHPESSPSDIEMYAAEVERIHAGEGYYDAAADELLTRGYPTLSVFNWRTPLPMWMIGQMPAIVFGKVVLGLLALGVIVLAFEALAREEGNRLRRPVACALLLTGPLMFCVLGELYVSPELWTGVLIALSLGAYGVGRRRLGLLTGLAALFFRELAMPYCLVCLALDLKDRRWREVKSWLVGLSAWGVFYTLHALQVWAVMSPDAWALEKSWIQFGGTAFVLSTAQMNAYLLTLPQWVTALYFVGAMFAMAGWHTPLGLRAGLTVCLFVVAFAVVGQPVNQYWGTLMAPLLCFAFARCPASVADLWKAAEMRKPAGSWYRGTKPSPPMTSGGST